MKSGILAGTASSHFKIEVQIGAIYRKMKCLSIGTSILFNEKNSTNMGSIYLLKEMVYLFCHKMNLCNILEKP